MTAGKQFPSKLLIAGEFTVLTGGDALAIPFDQFKGVWGQLDEADKTLFPFGEYLRQAEFIDANRLIIDLNEGWQFLSNIPVGYGLGSSGALSAAIYHHYRNTTGQDLNLILNQLAFIEHYFHGKSSGFDPLISYKNQGFALLNHQLTSIPVVSGLQQIKTVPLYLLDSGITRGHINSISWFYIELEKMQFREKIKLLTEYNSALTQAWFHDRIEELPELFRMISLIEYEHFEPLITASIQSVWEKGLASHQYYIKLCGKGGGGYYLLWKNDIKMEPLTGLTTVSVL